MKKLLFLVALCACTVITFASEAADWYLYLWSNANNRYLDNPQFWTTDDGNVFKIQDYTLTEQGVKFCVHNNARSEQYGWGSESVTETGKAVQLAASTSATGWLELPVGTYNITFNAADKTIRFDEHSIRKVGSTTIDGISYDLYDNYHAVVTDNANDPYLRGGDISELNYVESLGAKFYTADSTAADPIRIMKDNGCNIVRLRLYNNPGTAVTTTSGSYRVPAGYLDPTDVLNLAKRAKEQHMKIVLTFHYSDYWTNALEQFKPTDWQSYSLDELKTAVYNYTYHFLQKMNAQGTTPDYVSLGNEISSGILFGQMSSMDAVNGSTDSGNLAALLNQGSAAVRAVCPEAKIILHLPTDKDYNVSSYSYFFNNIISCKEGNANYVDFDVVGASYYPYWANKKPVDILPSLANAMYSNYGKPLMIMETGYSWTQYRPYGRNGGNYEGQLHMNGVYNEASKSGQKAFMEELQSVIKTNSHILGYLYWDPVMVDQQVTDGTWTWWIKTCWAEKQSGNDWWENGNQVSNTTWFDYTGKALPVLEAVKEDAPAVPLSIIVDGTLYTTQENVITGDTNFDGKIDSNDIDPILDVIFGKYKSAFCDLSNKGFTDITDVNALINIICGK